MAKRAARRGKVRKYKKIVEIPIAEDIADMNLNEATRANAGNPYFAEQLEESSPRWLKVIFLIMAFFIIFSLAVLFLYSLFH